MACFLALRRLETFRGGASSRTWISRIAVNCCLLRLRAARRRVTWVWLDDRRGTQGPDMLPSHAPTPENATWSREISSAFSAAVSKLPKHLREAYTLFETPGLSLAEVASALGLSVSATKTRVFRARTGIRRSLQPVWSARRGKQTMSLFILGISLDGLSRVCATAQIAPEWLYDVGSIGA